MSYWSSVEETIDGKGLTGEAGHAPEYLAEGANGWQWIAHVNLKPL